MNVEELASGYIFVEGPRVADDGSVYFSDMHGEGGYHCKPPGQPARPVLPGRMWIGGGVLNADGGFICSGKGGLVRVHPDGRQTPLLTEVAGQPVIAINDIEADAKGGIFGGTIDFHAVFERNEMPTGCHFFYLAPDGELTILRDDVTVSNGLAFSPDGRTLYHCETTIGIWAYPLDESGRPGKPALLATMDFADGMVVDSAGRLWVAEFATGAIHRFRPDGVLDGIITIPGHKALSMSFGGTDLRDMVVATSGIPDEPGTAGIIRVRVDQPGLREHKARFA